MKNIIYSVTASIVVTVIVIVMSFTMSPVNYAGQTHLSGLSVGEDGLSVTDSGVTSLNGTLSVTGQVKLDGGLLESAVFATSSTGAGTLTQANISGINTILSTNAGALTLTMPASTTLTTFVPNAGDRVSMVIVNQGTALLTLAGGTGTLLHTASSTKAINIGGSARLDFVRKTNTDVIVLMSAGI